MAEALQPVDDPLAVSLQLGPAAPPAMVATALAESLRLPEADGPLAPWLRPDQVATARRLVHAMRRHGGALLADPVGSGKSYVGLAVARRLAEDRAIAILAPAMLLPQWGRLVRALDVDVALLSHEALSRGRVPPERVRVALLDESHRFRHPGIRRYRVLARWLVGRRCLLMSATPVVNRLEDLVHQLLLTLRDDVLAPAGLPSLRAGLGGDALPPALDALVFRRAPPRDRPSVTRRSVSTGFGAEEAALLDAIESLTLSTDPAVATLLRLGLVRALASSPAALHRMLQRYALLLSQAREALGAGRRFSRRELRTLLGGEPEQLQLWSLLPAPVAPTDLRLSDRSALQRLRRVVRPLSARPDARAAALAGWLQDGVPTLVFSGSVATVHYLREQLAPLQPAWVTGEAAGVGRSRLARGMVLGCFAPDGGRLPSVPAVLLATDVAAEGLDLQRIDRIVHYDLPWTSIRLRQREGRAVRLGGLDRIIEVVTLHPAPPLERRLAQLTRLLRKEELVRRAGLDEGSIGDDWRDRLPRDGTAAAAGSIAQVPGRRAGWLIGVALDPGLPAELTWWPDGTEPETVAAAAGAMLRAVGAAEERPVEEALRVAARSAAAALLRRRWRSASSAPATADELLARRLGRRLLALAREAGRFRRLGSLRTIEAALDWLRGGRSAGEAMLVEELLALEAGPLLRRLGTLPPTRRAAAPQPRITGIVRVTTLSPCLTSAPCSSISTGP